MEVAREEEFAPVKNKEGPDSPDTARQALIDLHRSWLKRRASRSRRTRRSRSAPFSPSIRKTWWKGSGTGEWSSHRRYI
jgi:hypothetical protein